MHVCSIRITENEWSKIIHTLYVATCRANPPDFSRIRGHERGEPKEKVEKGVQETHEYVPVSVTSSSVSLGQMAERCSSLENNG